MTESLVREWAEEVNQKIKDLERHLGEGRAEDFSDYKYLSGEIYGLKQSLSIYENLRDAKLKEQGDD